MVAEPILLAGAAVLGLCFGSFLNVCIIRLAREDKRARSLFHPPSTCPSCGRRIAWRDNVPVASWLLLKGKCRACSHPISPQYPLIELAVGALWLVAMLAYGPTWRFLAAAAFGTILLGIAVTDARHYLIPDEYNWAGLVLGFAFSLAGGAQGFLHAVLGAAAGFGVLFAVGAVGRWLLREDAMGGGDIKMMAMVGTFVGWQGALLTIFLGAVCGSLVYVPLLLLKKKRLVPFGVFLAVGAAVAFVAGASILDWYQRFLKGT